MNNYMNNEKDLTKVFDKRWIVNHETSKNISEKAKRFKENVEKSELNGNPMEVQINRINRRIEELNKNRNKFW